MNATIQDVAASAHVSVSTVSRAFNNPSLVSNKTRARVLEAARRLNFSIMRSATVLKSGQSLRIALLINSPIQSWFNSSILEGLNTIFNPAGYDIAIRRILTLQERQDFFRDLPIRRNADAVIVTSFDIDKDEVERLHSADVPLVGINSSLSELFDAAVNIDDVQGGMLLARHLLSLGHRNIAFIITEMYASVLHFSAQKRVNAFLDTCRVNGVEPTIIKVADSHDQIDDALTQIFSLSSLPTAIACQEDGIAVPLMFELQKSGIEVPVKVSVTGFDDSLYAHEIGLTTIHQDPIRLGEIAAKKALDLIAGKKITNPCETVPAKLILRSSTSRPRHEAESLTSARQP